MVYTTRLPYSKGPFSKLSVDSPLLNEAYYEIFKLSCFFPQSLDAVVLLPSLAGQAEQHINYIPIEMNIPNSSNF